MSFAREGQVTGEIDNHPIISFAQKGEVTQVNYPAILALRKLEVGDDVKVVCGSNTSQCVVTENRVVSENNNCWLSLRDQKGYVSTYFIPGNNSYVQEENHSDYAPLDTLIFGHYVIYTITSFVKSGLGVMCDELTRERR